MKRKITMNEQLDTTLESAWEIFITSQTSKGVSNATIRNYHTHLKGIRRHLDISMPLDRMTKRDLEQMVVSMRAVGLAHNTIATYLRVLNTFLRWCQKEGF